MHIAIRRLKKYWNDSPALRKGYLAFATFMTIGSFLGLSGEIVKWRGFARDTFHMYEIIADFIVGIVGKLPFIEILPDERDKFILLIVFWSATIRFKNVFYETYMSKTIQQKSKADKNRMGFFKGLALLFIAIVPFAAMIGLLQSLIAIVLPYGLIRIDLESMWLRPDSAVYILSAGTLPIISVIYLLLVDKHWESSGEAKEEAIDSLIAYFSVIVFAFIVVGLFGAIYSGISAELP